MRSNSEARTAHSDRGRGRGYHRDAMSTRREGLSRVLALACVVASLALAAVLPVSAQSHTPTLSELHSTLRQSIHPGSVRPARAGSSSSKDIETTYHYGTKLQCSDCHVMHASKDGETFNGSAPSPLGYPKLLKAASTVDLCLLCHENTPGVPDVVGADVNGLTERSAGAFAAKGVVNAHGHNIGDSTYDLCSQCHFPHSGDNMQNAKVACVDCHDPHGNGRARNLQWFSYPVGTPPLGLFTNPAASGLQRYEAANTAYGTDGTDNLREVTNICVDCHHTISGSYYVGPAGNGSFHKHPVNETERGASVPVSEGDARGSTDSAHWVTGTGAGFDVPRVRFCVDPAATYSQATTVAPSNRVFCLTCHKAHGSEQNDSVAWQSISTDVVGPNGCQQCHNKG